MWTSYDRLPPLFRLISSQNGAATGSMPAEAGKAVLLKFVSGFPKEINPFVQTCIDMTVLNNSNWTTARIVCN